MIVLLYKYLEAHWMSPPIQKWHLHRLKTFQGGPFGERTIRLCVKTLQIGKHLVGMKERIFSSHQGKVAELKVGQSSHQVVSR